MSLSSALSIALSGLQSTSTALSVVSANVSNANTAGYTKKSVDFSTVTVGSSSGGVNIDNYQRLTDSALSGSYNTSTSNAGYLSTQYNYLTQVQSILDSTSTNPSLSSDLSTFQSDWNNLSASPESSIQQQTVINDGNSLAHQIQTINNQVSSLQKQVTSDIGTTLATLNSVLKSIQTLNTQIATALAANQSTGNLEDKRDTIINQISSMTSVTVMTRSSDQVALYTPSGTNLLDGTAQVFSFDGTHITNSSGQNVNSGLIGGSLQAQLNFIDTSTAAASSSDYGTGVIAKIQDQLSTLVSAFTDPGSAFVTAYGNAVTASTASGASQSSSVVASSFFTVSTNSSTGKADPGSFSVNSSLLDRSAEVPQTGVTAISDSFTSTASYTASGLSSSNVTYSQLATDILSNFQSAANSLKTSSTDAQTQQTYYQTALTNATGVNSDSELVMLTTLQNSYAAAAHVISTINSLYQTLANIL